MKKNRLLILANIYIYIFFTYRVKIEHDFQARFVFHENYSLGELVHCYDTEPPSCHYLSR